MVRARKILPHREIKKDAHAALPKPSKPSWSPNQFETLPLTWQQLAHDAWAETVTKFDEPGNEYWGYQCFQVLLTGYKTPDDPNGDGKEIHCRHWLRCEADQIEPGTRCKVSVARQPEPAADDTHWRKNWCFDVRDIFLHASGASASSSV